MYKIEALENGRWVDDAVGDENRFETYDEAEEMIPVLAKEYECPEDEFRVAQI